MLAFEDIKKVHLEISSKCNAACPQCPRNIDGGPVNLDIKETELSLINLQTIFPPQFVSKLREIYLCGNYGDPITASDCLDACRYFRSANGTIRLRMYTNGSARSLDWWRELAYAGVIVRFSIDGLSDTNHIYRRHTVWNRIMQNVEAFIAAGGKAEWDYIVFRHNEHQVDAARELASKLGFDKFFLKRTKRFFDPKSPNKVRTVPVRNNDGMVEYYIEPPSNPEFLIDLPEQWVNLDAYEDYLSSTPICCRAVSDRMIFVSAQGRAFPCCWTASLHNHKGAKQIRRLAERWPRGLDELSALEHSLRVVVEGEFFQALVPQSLDGLSERLRVCSETCGAKAIQPLQFGKSKI